MSAYDEIARIYDPWSRTVVEDVAFYVEEAVRSGGPVVELGVGTGRIAVPIALAGVAVIGVDSSQGMMAVARERAQGAGVEVDLRFGDLRSPPVEGEFPLVIAPFRSLLHMESDEDRRAALRAVRELLVPGGRFVFDVAWLTVPEWTALLRDAGFSVDGLYGWFDRTRWKGHEDSIWVCSKRG